VLCGGFFARLSGRVFFWFWAIGRQVSLWRSGARRSVERRAFLTFEQPGQRRRLPAPTWNQGGPTAPAPSGNTDNIASPPSSHLPQKYDRAGPTCFEEWTGR